VLWATWPLDCDPPFPPEALLVVRDVEVPPAEELAVEELFEDESDESADEAEVPSANWPVNFVSAITDPSAALSEVGAVAEGPAAELGCIPAWAFLPAVGSASPLPKALS
jgi:hypothetical protein